MEFSTRTLKRLVSSQTSKKVSKPAAEQIGKEIEQRGETIAEKAVKYAQQDNRVTVRKEDIKQAIQQHEIDKITGQNRVIDKENLKESIK